MMAKATARLVAHTIEVARPSFVTAAIHQLIRAHAIATAVMYRKSVGSVNWNRLAVLSTCVRRQEQVWQLDV